MVFIKPITSILSPKEIVLFQMSGDTQEELKDQVLISFWHADKTGTFS